MLLLKHDDTWVQSRGEGVFLLAVLVETIDIPSHGEIVGIGDIDIPVERIHGDAIRHLQSGAVGDE